MLFIKLVVFSSQLSLIQNVVPGPVSKLNYGEDTDISVTITWKPPKEPNGVIVAYFVEHGVYQKDPTTNVTIFGGRPMYTVIRALGKLLPMFISKLRLLYSCAYHSILCYSPKLSRFTVLETLVCYIVTEGIHKLDVEQL